MFFVGCYDMQYEDMDEYYDSFGDTVYLNYIEDDGRTFNDDSASIKENFLNEKTQDKFSESCLISEEYYAYFAVRLEDDEDLTFDDLCLYIKAEETVYMEVRIYVVDELPSMVRGFLAEPKNGKKETAYDDEFEDPIAVIATNLSAGTFKDLFVEKWTIDGNRVKNITLKSDQYLLLQFYNNTGYGHDDGYESVKFTMTNFVLSKVSD